MLHATPFADGIRDASFVIGMAGCAVCGNGRTFGSKIDAENDMLAPLKDRSMIGAVAPATSAAPHCDTKSEIEDLHRALKESRDRLRRGAWESTRQISRLNAEVSRLQALCANYEARLERDATERAFVEPAQALMRCSDSNECLMNSIHQVWLLEKNIGAAHREYQKLAAERDALVQQLHQTRLAPLSARSGGGK